MDCEAVDDDRKTLRSRCLAEALHQNDDGRCLRVEKTRVVAEHDIVEHDIDVGDFVRVKRCNYSVRLRHRVASRDDKL